MNLDELKTIEITKDRGWRGQVEINIKDRNNNLLYREITTFSPRTWLQLLSGYVVITDSKSNTEQYLILQFDNLIALPKITQQRSVLIRNFKANILHIAVTNNAKIGSLTNYEKQCLDDYINDEQWKVTNSKFNQVGIRVNSKLITNNSDFKISKQESSGKIVLTDIHTSSSKVIKPENKPAVNDLLRKVDNTDANFYLQFIPCLSNI